MRRKEDKVVAIVNGHEIKVSEVQMATDDIIGQLPDLPPKLRFPFVVEYLIERHLLAQFAVKEGIADTDEYKRRLALYQAKALRDAYFFQKIRPQVTEEEMKAVYDEEAAKLQQTERVRARHILVGTEQEAKDILAASPRARSSRIWPSSSASTAPRITAAISAISPRPKWCRSSPRRPSR